MENATMLQSFHWYSEGDGKLWKEVAGAPLPSIVGFPKQLEMLFYNVFRNCIRYRRQNSPLAITIEQVVYQKNLYQKQRL